MDEEMYVQLYKEGEAVATLIVDSNLKEVGRKGNQKQFLDKLKIDDLVK